MEHRNRRSISRQRVSPSQVFGVLRVALQFIWGVMEPILRKASNRIIVEEGIPLARKIVADLQDKALTGSEKRDSARDQLKSALVGTKKIVEDDIASSMLNWVIETAVAELKAKTNPD